ncbi:hypothetical protein Q9233_006614 [Columba guinea]|nr:hypothetical protein Q9233_006614 [Columba guinea]
MCHKLNLPSKLFVARNGCTKSADAKETALDWAVKHGNLEMAEMVAKAGVDVNAKSLDFEVIYYSVSYQSKAVSFDVQSNAVKMGILFLMVFIHSGTRPSLAQPKPYAQLQNNMNQPLLKVKLHGIINTGVKQFKKRKGNQVHFVTSEIVFALVPITPSDFLWKDDWRLVGVHVQSMNTACLTSQMMRPMRPSPELPDAERVLKSSMLGWRQSFWLEKSHGHGHSSSHMPVTANPTNRRHVQPVAACALSATAIRS